METSNVNKHAKYSADWMNLAQYARFVRLVEIHKKTKDKNE